MDWLWGLAGRRSRCAACIERKIFALAMGVALATSLLVVVSPPSSDPAWASTTGWRVSTSYPAVPGTSAIACPSISNCFAVGGNSSGFGDILATTDFGAKWTLQAVPAGTGVLSAVACTSITNCYATGVDPAGANGLILATTNAGKTWTTQARTPGLTGLDGIRCPTATVCYSFGGNSFEGSSDLFATSNAGKTWSTQPVPTGGASLTGINCPSKTTCFVVGSNPSFESSIILSTNDGGKVWRSDPVPAGVGILNTVMCLSPTACFAGGEGIRGGGVILATTSGVGWTTQILVPGIEAVNSMICRTTVHLLCRRGRQFGERGHSEHRQCRKHLEGPTTPLLLLPVPVENRLSVQDHLLLGERAVRSGGAGRIRSGHQ